MLILDIKTGAESKYADPLQLVAYGEGYMAYKDQEPALEMGFDKESHTYRQRGGHRLPSVTQCTRALVNQEYFTPGSAQIGSYRHKCCELWDYGTLEYDQLDPIHTPYVDAWYDFLCYYGLENEPVLIEEPFYHPTYLYAGTIDRIYPEYAPGEMLLWNVYLTNTGKYRKKNRLKDPKKRDLAFNDFLVLKRTVDMQILAGKNLEKVCNTETPRKLIEDLTEVFGQLESPYLKGVIKEIIGTVENNQEEEL